MAAITGVFCIHALICTRIWHIVPEGSRFTYDKSVISFMESENVTIGSHKRADYSLLEKKLEEKYPDITWCSIYIEKNTMKIDISEGINYR